MMTVRTTAAGMPLAFLFALAVAVGALHPRSAAAQNAAFQDFLFAGCVGATGELRDRCDETDDGAGNVSGDSESSLVPTQGLGSTQAALREAQARIEALTKVLEERRDPDEPGSNETVREVFQSSGFSALVSAKGAFVNRDASALERGSDSTIVSLAAGGDYRVTDDWIVGALFTYDRLDLEFDADDAARNFEPFGSEGSTISDSYGISLFATVNLFEQAYVEATASIAYTDYDISRTVVFQESNRLVPQTNVITNADNSGLNYSASVGAGYDFSYETFTMGPYGRLSFVASEVDGYSESGGSGLALAVDETDDVSFGGVLGVRASWAISTGFGVVVPSVRAEYEKLFVSEAPESTVRFVDDPTGAALSLEGDPVDDKVVRFGSSLLFVLPNGWLPYVDGEVERGRKFTDRWVISGGLRKEF